MKLAFFPIVFVAVLAFLFGGCSGVPQPSSAKKEAADTAMPAWVAHPDAPGVLRAVGSAPRNFQGVYMQRDTALADARDKLAHKIAVVISAAYTSKLKADRAALDRRMRREITEVSQLLLHQSRQVAGYIDRRGRLDLLVETPDPTAVTSAGSSGLPPLETEAFDPAVLKKSRCYPPAVTGTVRTRYPLYLGRPVWFFRPDYLGKPGAVGIAEKEPGSDFERQKRAAEALAKADLAKRRRLQMDSQHRLMKILRHDIMGGTFDKRLQAKSTSRITDTLTRDLWLDPKSCELYLWVTEK